MDSTILLFLLQDGITNGAIYALLGLAMVMVFAVTRVVFIPQGEFVAYGSLTYAILETGMMPATAWMLIGFGVAAFIMDLWSERATQTVKSVARNAVQKLVIPILIAAATYFVVKSGFTKGGQPLLSALLTILIVAPMGPYLYRIAFQPIADATVLTLLIAAVGVHLAMTGLGLVFFGAEGLRAEPLSSASMNVGPMLVSGQSIGIYVITIALIVGLYLFFENTLYGKALRATAVSRFGARIVGIRTSLSGRIAFALATVVGVISGILIVPITTVYYDTGFIIGLKGFVAAIIAGLASYPLTAIAALLVGIVEAFSSFFASDYKEVIVFMMIIPILIWRSLHTVHVEEEE